MEHLENEHDTIVRGLNQLAGMGLIAKIAVPNPEGEYVTGYRGLRQGELSKNDDIQILKRKGE